jgi:hypothetical protein
MKCRLQQKNAQNAKFPNQDDVIVVGKLAGKNGLAEVLFVGFFAHCCPN